VGARIPTTQPGQTLSHYRLVAKIGEGGMGVVWKALDTKLGRHVALKLLPLELTADPERSRRFLREARSAAAVTHTNIAAIHEIDEAEVVTFIAMELVEGRTLRSVIGGRPMPISEALCIASEIAEGLTRAHQAHIVHRDLKPDNVVLGADGHPKILDFGLAKLVEGQHDLRSRWSRMETRTEQMTREGEVLGTAAYMSPEQARGETVDARSDIFSFGVTLYEMVTGRIPFRGQSPIETLAAILHQPAVPASRFNTDVPSGLEGILGKCLEKDLRGRYQSSQDLVVDLRRLLRELESGSSSSYGEIREARTPRWRRAGAVAIAAVLAIGVAAWFVARLVHPWTTRTADARTVLILPLEVRGQAEGADYVGRALAEAIAVNLAQSKNLIVLPVPEKGEAGQDRPKSGRRAALASRAGRLLTGAVVRDAKGLHASVSLLDPEQNRIVWGIQKTAEADDLPGLAASMARELSKELGAETPRLYDTLLRSPVPPQMAASPDLIEFRAATRRVDLSASLAATKRLMKSFPNEPSALAFHLLSLFQHASESGPSSPEMQEFERGAAALARADPNNPYADHFRALLLSFHGRFKESVQLFTKILSRTDLAPAARALVLLGRGQAHSLLKETDLALADLEEALRLDPADDLNFSFAASILRFLGRNEESLIFARNALALNPESYQNNWSLGDTLYRLRQWEEAVPPLRKACAINATQWVYAFYALALLRAGHKTEAKAAVKRAAALPEHYLGSYYLACFHAVSGDRREAIRLLRRAFEGAARQGGGSLEDYEDLRKNLDLLPLHGDPEFEKILAEVKERGSHK
jgi:eukaryotic-like serine/threonine-protein kinase